MMPSTSSRRTVMTLIGRTIVGVAIFQIVSVAIPKPAYEVSNDCGDTACWETVRDQGFGYPRVFFGEILNGGDFVIEGFDGADLLFDLAVTTPVVALLMALFGGLFRRRPAPADDLMEELSYSSTR